MEAVLQVINLERFGSDVLVSYSKIFGDNGIVSIFLLLCRQSREREQKMPKRQLLHVDLYFRRNQDANTEK